MWIKAFTDGKEVIESLEERITGRYSCESLYDADGTMIVKANHMITPKRAAKIMATGVDKVKIRNVLSCKITHWCLCKMLWC